MPRKLACPAGPNLGRLTRRTTTGKPAQMAKLALVTAGPSAIGRSFVTALAGAGFDVGFTHLGQSEAAVTLIAAVQSLGRHARAWESDASDAAQVAQFHAEAAAWAGSAPSVMVNNAGIQTWSSLLDLNPICGHMPKCRRRGMGLRTTPSVIAEQGGTKRVIRVSP